MDQDGDPVNLLRGLIDAFGGQRAFARALGTSGPSVNKWLRSLGGGVGVPAERCLQVERILGVPGLRYRLRPDVYGALPSELLAELAIQAQAA